MITRRGFLKLTAMLPAVPLAMQLPAGVAQAVPAPARPKARQLNHLAFTPAGDLYVGGRFTDLMGDRHYKIAKWDGRLWQALDAPA